MKQKLRWDLWLESHHRLLICPLRTFDRRFWDTPVVKSSSRELCYIILAGICLGYLCTFSLIAKPHIAYCYLQRLGIGLSPAMSYSALVTKVLLASARRKIS